MEQRSIFNRVPRYKELRLYQKAEVLVLLTDVFCKRFLSAYGDRTVDQMNQAARSGKQNIVEGSETSMTSSETEVKLINVARASFQELREDYEDYLKKHALMLWDGSHPRYAGILDFCRNNNSFDAYRSLSETVDAEVFCNLALTLCHFVDKMFDSYLKHLETRFKEEGGIKERMHAVRTGYRQEVDNKINALEEENRRLKEENRELKRRLGIG